MSLPIEISNYADKMDSYNYLSIYKFMTDESKGYIFKPEFQG